MPNIRSQLSVKNLSTALALLGGIRGKKDGPQDVARVPLVMRLVSEFSVTFESNNYNLLIFL